MASDVSFLYNQPVVIDNGSAMVKAGFSGQERPKFFEHSIVGVPKKGNVNIKSLGDETYIGNKAQDRRGVLQLRHPMEHGVIVNWNDIESIWSHVFNESLQLKDVDEHPVLITEAPLNPMGNRDEMCQVLYELFGVSALYVANPAVLSLYASGRTTGCVLECGDGYSCAVPVFEGYTLTPAIKRVDYAGRDITEQLQRQLRKSAGVSLFSSGEKELVRIIKEKACYVATDLEEEREKITYNSENMNIKFKLPDGQLLTLKNDRFTTPEILFQPHLIASESDGLPGMLWQAILKTDTDLRPHLLSHILLSGGTTMLHGFGSRMLQELEDLTQKRSTIKIWAPPERKYTAWVGGSILAGLSTFQRIMVTRSQWQEDPSVIHAKCN